MQLDQYLYHEISTKYFNFIKVTPTIRQTVFETNAPKLLYYPFAVKLASLTTPCVVPVASQYSFFHLAIDNFLALIFFLSFHAYTQLRVKVPFIAQLLIFMIISNSMHTEVILVVNLQQRFYI